jgi:hypothetical protein
VSLKKAARIGFVAVALSAAALVVAAGPALASQIGTGASAPTSHHKGTDQLDEDGPSYNEPDAPKDADQEESDITPGGVPVHGSASAISEAPAKILPGDSDPYASDDGGAGLGGGGLGN